MLKKQEKIKAYRGISVNHFRYIKGRLYAEEVPVSAIAEAVGTPVYIYSHATLTRHFDVYEEAFHGFPHILCYAVKANSNRAILRLFAKKGGGADVVSGGELYRALKAGIRANKVVYAGVGKTADEIAFSLKSKILMLNVESFEELHEINSIAGRLNTKAPIALRINPDIDPQTHPYISTGLKKHKFGIPFEEALNAYKTASRLKNIEIVGIHMHIGSQLTKISPFVDSVKRVLALLVELRAHAIEVKYLDIGGGLGINYKDEQPPHPTEFAKAILPLLKDTGVTLILEPGRSIVGNAGILVTQTLYHKRAEGKDFVIVDAAMNDLIRPSIYGAYHHLGPVVKGRSGKKMVADIVGPVCESGDFLAKDREITRVKRGDLLAVMSAGAYGFSMSSNYNSRPRPAEVMVKGNEFAIIRRRETYNDLIRGEAVPEFLRQ